MWMQTLPVAPRAVVFDRATVVADAAAAVHRMNEPGFDVWREAVLLPAGAEAAKALRQTSGLPGRASYHRPSPEHITVEVAASTDSLLSIAEHFDPGWAATVDGRPAPVVETDLVAMGVPIAPGRHHVELRFWPVGLTWGLWCAAATAAALLLWSVLTKRVGKLTGSVT
jgi:hypothetical protein